LLESAAIVMIECPACYSVVFSNQILGCYYQNYYKRRLEKANQHNPVKLKIGLVIL